MDNNTSAFFALLRAGLWEEGVQLSTCGNVNIKEIYRLAQEQSVVGIVTAGLEHVEDSKLPQEDILTIIGDSLQIEQRNKAMNAFVGWLMQLFQKESVFALLVKGQGVAQCYERPLWRTSGDVDLLLDNENYEKAKTVLSPIASKIEPENKATKHQAYNIKGFEVELHGKMPFALSRKTDSVIDEVLANSFNRKGLNIWRYEDTDVYIPNPENHIALVFTHFLHHFFIEGVGLRQICDWCRMLWAYKDSLNHKLLESRICEMGLMSEWRVFAAIAIETLGMPAETMPFYKEGYTRRANLVLKRILKSGNFGHNNDLSYRVRYEGLKYQMVSLWRRFLDFFGMAFIFPIDAPRFFVTYVLNKAK